VRIGHIELLDAEGENFLFHFLGVIGLEFQVDCLQKAALIHSGALVGKAEVVVIQLKAVRELAVPSFAQARDRTEKRAGARLLICMVPRLRFDPALFRRGDAGAAAARANLTLGQRRMATGALFNLRRSSASAAAEGVDANIRIVARIGLRERR
jgi:hypothetical protein